MKSSTITAVGIFAVLVILLFLLPQTTKQQMQGALFQWISPILRTGASVGQELGGVRGGLKRLDELERENQQLKLENEQLRAANSLLNNLETEVNRLNRALGFREQSPFKLLPARVISQGKRDLVEHLHDQPRLKGRDRNRYGGRNGERLGWQDHYGRERCCCRPARF